MNTGELACGALGRIGLSESGLSEIKLRLESTGKFYDQEFSDLLTKLKNLRILKSYNFLKKGIIWNCIQLSETGERIEDIIKDDEMRKYFIVAITIYCNQRKFTPNELAELLSKTDSFKSKDEVEKILENFRKRFITEEKSAMVEGISKMAIEIKDCVFDILVMEEVK